MAPSRPTAELESEAQAEALAANIPDLMLDLPNELLVRWAEGPLPEPHCNICRSVGALTEKHLDDDKVFNAVQVVVDWHDEPLGKQVRYYSPETYHRCLWVYQHARALLALRKAVSP